MADPPPVIVDQIIADHVPLVHVSLRRGSYRPLVGNGAVRSAPVTVADRPRVTRIDPLEIHPTEAGALDAVAPNGVVLRVPLYSTYRCETEETVKFPFSK